MDVTTRASVGSVRVGCSGWSYADWRGPVYPPDLPRRRWFERYQQLFDTVELNATFYRLPETATMEKWAADAGPGFLYGVKLGGYGSHRKKLRDPEQWLPNHLDRAYRLGEHLGPNLVQLPRRWRRNVARLDDFLADAVPTRPSVRWAVELREPSWLHDDVFDTLQRHGAALCLHDLLPDHPFVLTTDWTYVRFHGPEALVRPYHGLYGPPRLAAWAERLGGLADDGVDSYAYFNSDWHANAVRDAFALRAALGESVRVPSELAG
jgi:uncharacterized protein YecE (DUF72 family)